MVIIAEKPFQGRDIARALCPQGLKEGRNWHEGTVDGIFTIFTWADGHIIDLAWPEAYDQKWKKWQLETLPIQPPGFEFKRDIKDENRLKAIKQAMQGATEVINACDAAREGELIFHEIAMALGFYECKQLSRTRMWVSDNTGPGIRASFDSRYLADNKKLLLLREAAQVRGEADWLWGINLTRYATIGLASSSTDLAGHTIHIGRVQTALLKAITDRTRLVRQHKPEVFYQINLKTEGSGGPFEAKLITFPEEQFGHRDIDFRNIDFVKEITQHIDATTPQLWRVDDAPYREAEEFAPPPFNLVDLQRSAFRIFGWSPFHTLRVAQRLYAGLKAISYPRTESFHLPEEMQATVLERRRCIWNDWALQRFPALRSLPFREEPDYWFNNDKVTDHYGIIPTGVIPPVMDEHGALTDTYRLWEIITTRFLLAWLPPARLRVASRVLIREFKQGKQLRGLLKTNPVIETGWLLYEEATVDTRRTKPALRKRLEEKIFPACGLTARVIQADIQQCYTYPPDYFNYDTILHFMVVNSLGTSATRAEVIEKLLDLKYIVQSDHGSLFASPEGAQIVDILALQGGEGLLEVGITAFWEMQLEKMEKASQDRITREVFLTNIMSQIVSLGIKLVADIDSESVVFCPKRNNRVVLENGKWRFDGYRDADTAEFQRGRKMQPSEYRDIFMGGKKGAGPFDGFISTRGKCGTYSAHLVFNSQTNRFDLDFKRGSRTK